MGVIHVLARRKKPKKTLWIIELPVDKNGSKLSAKGAAGGRLKEKASYIVG